MNNQHIKEIEVKQFSDKHITTVTGARRHVEQADSIRRAGYRPQFAGSLA